MLSCMIKFVVGGIDVRFMLCLILKRVVMGFLIRNLSLKNLEILLIIFFLKRQFCGTKRFFLNFWVICNSAELLDEPPLTRSASERPPLSNQCNANIGCIIVSLIATAALKGRFEIILASELTEV